MTRNRDGFEDARSDVNLMGDLRVVHLWREYPDDPGFIALVVCAYEATRLASWKAGQRVRFRDVAPFWMADVDAVEAAAIKGRFLSDDGTVLDADWVSFDEAVDRRDSSRVRSERQAEKRRQERAAARNGRAEIDVSGLPPVERY